MKKETYNNQDSCKRCGACPHCGRSDSPWFRTYPWFQAYYPYHQFYPYYYQTGTTDVGIQTSNTTASATWIV